MNGSAHASRSFFVLLTLFVVVAALRLAQEVFIPLALALLMTLLLAPLVNRLQRWGINRYVAVVFTVAIAFAVVGGLLYVVFDQLRDLAGDLPQYRRQLLHNVTTLTGTFKGPMGRTFTFFNQLDADLRRVAPVVRVPHNIPKVEVVAPPLDSVQAMRQVFSPLIGPIATGGVVVVFVIFMLLRFNDLRDRVIRLLGSRNLRATSQALDEAAARVSRYLLMQTLINCWEGLCITAGLLLIGLPNAILWGALTAVLRFIPYVGIWVAAAMPIALAFAVFDHWAPPLQIAGLFVAVELLSYMILEPWLYSRRTGVSPLALLMAAVFWAWLWGAAGLFLAIPLTVCLVVMGKYIPQFNFFHVMLSDQPVLEPHERLYHRLLANVPEEADDLLEDQLRQCSLVQVCDSVLLPTMRLVERDHEQGALRDIKRQYVLDYIERWTEELADSVAHGHAPEPPDQGASAPPAPGGEPGGLAPRLAPRPAHGEEAHPVGVLCLPAADRADEIAGRLFCAVLASHGVPARAAPRIHLRSLSREPAPALVVISAMPADAVTHARHVCRRTRVQFGEVPVIAGLWNSDGDLARSAERLKSAGVAQLATSFAQALEEAGDLLGEQVPATEPPAMQVAIS